MAITSLPTPPTRQDPNTFASRGDAFLAALPTFVSEANSLASDVNSKQAACSLSETNAANSATASSAAATAALSAVSGAIGLNTVAVTGTSQAAVASNLYVLQNAATTTVTLPASPVAGSVVAVLVANGRIDNVIARNGKQIQGMAEDMTLDNASASVLLRYVDSTSQWRLV